MTQFVACPECGEEQADRGRFVACDVCGYAPMPTHDGPESEIAEEEPHFFNGVTPRKSAA
jgi:hypothetical protein